MQILGTASHALSAAAFAFLFLLLLFNWQGRRSGSLLLVAVAFTVLWSLVFSFGALNYQRFSIRFLLLIDFVRMALWLGLLLQILDQTRILRLSGVQKGLIAATALYVLVHLVFLSGFVGNIASHGQVDYVVGISGLCLAFASLFLLEQLYRNSYLSQRWALKFFCLGVGLIAAFDLYLYSVVVLYRQVDIDIWFARGVITSLSVPLFAIAIRRNKDWSLEIFVSRQALVYTASVFVVAVYLIAMALGGYYIRLYGGTWGVAAQLVFVFVAGLGLLLLLFSGSLRAKLRVFLGKHFYRNKYDYRSVWLRFTKALSEPMPYTTFHDRIIVAVCETIESPAGALWLKSEDGNYHLEGHWNLTVEQSWILEQDSPVIQFLEDRAWVIDSLELKEQPKLYDHLQLPTWLPEMTQSETLTLPLYSSGEMVGVLVLLRPVQFNLTWEDTDLLKTVAQQVAGHIAEQRAQQKLAESSQFEAYNQLASFIMHDLKNLLAQQMLVVNNATRHKDNPEFVEDMISTIENSVGRMSNLLTQLRPEQFAEDRGREVKIADVVAEAISKITGASPEPQLIVDAPEARAVVDPSKLAMIVRHIVKNAQDATPADGQVEVKVFEKDDKVGISVKDNGKGMDVSFQKQKLFRPFITTKGSKGMGIGAYQAREFAREAGGDAHVISAPDVGTTFTVTMTSAVRP